MNGFNRILFPTDFSPQAEAAVPFVREMALRHGASIALLHAVYIPAYAYPPEIALPPAAIDPAGFVETGAELLEQFAKRHFSELPSVNCVSRYAAAGDPATLITDFAHERNIDLVMLPTHGLGVFRRWLIGSVTAKVLHDAHCAVWTGVHVEEPPVGQHPRIKTILCAIDVQSSAEDLIVQALRVAGKHGATVFLVHCVPGPEVGPERYFDQTLERSLIAASRGEIAGIQQRLQTSLEVCVASGSVSRVIHQAAVRHSADLIVAGRGRLQQPFGRLRTNVYSIIRDSPCPVISY